MNSSFVERDFVRGGPLDLLRSVICLNHELERTSVRLLRELGISAQQRLIVRGIGEFPGVPPAQLAERLRLDSGTVSAALRRLEAKELVERRRDARDSRRITLELTERGKALARPTASTVESAVDRLLGQVDARDVEATKRVLDALIAQLDADSTEAERQAGAS